MMLCHNQPLWRGDASHIEASERHKLTIDTGAGRLYGEDVSARLLQDLQLGDTKLRPRLDHEKQLRVPR